MTLLTAMLLTPCRVSSEPSENKTFRRAEDEPRDMRT